MALGNDPFADNDDAPAPGDPEIDLDSAQDDDDGDEPQQVAQPGTTPRKERRRNRYKEAMDRAAEAEKQAQELRVQVAALNERTNLLGQFAATQQQAQQPRRPDPIDEESSSIAREREVLYQQYQQRVSAGDIKPEEQADFVKRSRELEDKQVDLRVKRQLKEAGVGQPQQNAQVQAIATYLQMTYPELQDQRVDMYADGVRRTLVAAGWPPWDRRTIDEAMRQTREVFRIGQNGNGSNGNSQRREEPAMRERLQGSRGGGSGANQGNGDRKVVMTKPLRIMAERMYPKLAPEQAWQKYAREVVNSPDDE